MNETIELAARRGLGAGAGALGVTLAMAAGAVPIWRTGVKGAAGGTLGAATTSGTVVGAPAGAATDCAASGL